MKKKLFAIAALLMTFGHVLAQTSLTAENVTVPQNGQAYLVINYQFDSSVTYAGYSIDISLPEGLSLAKNTAGKYDYEKGDCYSETHTFTLGYNKDRKNYVVACISLDGDIMTGTTGTLIKIGIQADETLSTGEELTGYLKNIEFARANGSSESLEGEIPFTITIGQPDDGRIKFDETATKLPTYTAGEKGDVTMTRTIKAGSWSTIVLPFNLTKANAVKIFGEDVQFAKFSGFKVDYGEDEENVTPLGITVKFTSYSIPARGNLTGGTPVLIRTSKDITEPFQLDQVTLTDDIKGVSVEDEDELGTSGTFTATLVKTKVPADGLFISENKFWYSTGKTNIKAFRGWFNLGAVLDKETDFGAKISFYVDDEQTSIDGLSVGNGYIDGAVYTLSGQLVGKNVNEKLLKRGVYIKDGKKFVVK